MSCIFKTQGGGTGGEEGFFASIFVKGLSETDIVTASNGSKTKTAVWNAAESRFEITKIKDLGMWTVTATDGESIATQDVLVDVATEYEIEMSYVGNYLMLYDGSFGEAGELGENTCPEITGGFIANDITCNNIYKTFNGTPSFSESTIGVGYTAANSVGQRMQSISTAQQINLSDYVGFAIDANFGTTLDGGNAYAGFAATKQHVANNSIGLIVSPVNDFAKKIHTGIISSTEDAWFYIFALQSTSFYSRVTLHHAWIYKSDNITTLCSKAGLSAPTDLATLIADTTSIETILENKEAVKFMVSKCTGDFMVSFVASAACLSALGASPYESTIRANKHWAKFLAMVQ